MLLLGIIILQQRPYKQCCSQRHWFWQLNICVAIVYSVTYLEYESEPEASEFDLGTKIRTPKDIMLEELSLMKNRGSKMFKMRQQRVERFIYENNPDIFSSESMVRAMKTKPLSLDNSKEDLLKTCGCFCGNSVSREKIQYCQTVISIHGLLFLYDLIFSDITSIWKKPYY